MTKSWPMLLALAMSSFSGCKNRVDSSAVKEQEAQKPLALTDIGLYRDYSLDPDDPNSKGIYPAPILVFYGARVRDDVKVSLSENCRGHIDIIDNATADGKGLSLVCSPTGNTAKKVVFAKSKSTLGQEEDEAVKAFLFDYESFVSLKSNDGINYILNIAI